MDYLANLWNDYQTPVATFAIAVLCLLLFFVLAKIVKGILNRLLLKTSLDNRFTETVGMRPGFPVEKVVSETAFWLIMVFGLLTFFEVLNLQTVTEPLNVFLNEVFVFLPKLGAALLLLAIAWVLAALLKRAIRKVAALGKLDERLNKLNEGEEATRVTISESLATAGYWFVFLLFLPLVLGALEMEGLVIPLQDMFSELFTYLPNILSAVIIFAVGYFVARVVRQIITSLLAASGVDSFSTKSGLSQKISHLIGTLIYTFILLLVIVQSLDALEVAAISQPAQEMIDMIFLAVPGIIAATLVIGISYYVGKLVATLVTDLLSAAGFNNITEKLGLKMGLERTPSEYVGYLVLIGIILFAVLGATELLQFEPLSYIVTTLIGFAVQVILAAIILAIGIYIANKAKTLVAEAGVPATAANLARVAILALATAMALRQVGLAEDIIVLAFGLLLGAIAVGAAIAIGLGSRELAGKEVEAFLSKLKK